MTKQKSMVQSAAALVLSFITSSTKGAFITSSRSACNPQVLTSQNFHSSSFSYQNCRNLPNHPYFQYTARDTRKYFGCSCVIKRNMVTTKSNDNNISSLVEETAILLLPYEDGSHNSAKIIIPEKGIDTEFDDVNEDDNCNRMAMNGSDEASTSATAKSIEKAKASKSCFRRRLEATIEACKQLQKSSLWITVPMNQARFIESMTDISGLELHHTDEKQNIHLSKWLKDDIENKIPQYATHQVGVGAMVVNSKNEILCVREIRNNYRPWKIPGGLAELGEQLDVAAIREVKEETGIECRFKGVLSFRHTHGMQFGRSDLYFVCRLEPLEMENEETGALVIPEPVAQEGEIAVASWVPLSEYRGMINGKEPHPMMQKNLQIFDEKGDIQQSVVTSIVPGRTPSPIYHTQIGP